MQQVTYIYPRKPEQEQVKQTFDIPPLHDGVNVEVECNYHDRAVNLIVDHKRIVMTLDGARNLALLIRQAANQVEKGAVKL